MKDLKAKFSWSIITSNIDDPKNAGNNIVNIFMPMRSLKLEHVKKQAYQYWGPGDGNDCAYVLGISDIGPEA